MEVAQRKVRDVLQRSEVQNFQPPILYANQLLLAQQLEASVRVNRRQPKRIGHILLRQREGHAICFDALDILHSYVELAQQMGNAAQRAARSNIDEPFAQHRLVDQCGPS